MFEIFYTFYSDSLITYRMYCVNIGLLIEDYALDRQLNLIQNKDLRIHKIIRNWIDSVK